MTTRSVERLKELAGVGGYTCADYIHLAAEWAPGPDGRQLYRALGLDIAVEPGSLEVQLLGLDWQDLLVLAMISSDEEHGPILQDLYPDLWDGIADAQQPLRDDDGAAADRAYGMARDRAVGL